MEDRKNYLMDIGRLAQSYGFVPIPIFGKIPRFRNWQLVKYDPKDPEKLIRRIGHLYDAKIANNIGILTGEPSGVVVLDVEFSGLPWWEELVRLNGEFPETFTVQTGTGGKHIYFKYAPPVDKLHNLNKILHHDLDFRTNGGHAVFAGSTDTRTGNTYVVLSGYKDNIPTIVEMPPWLFNLLQYDQGLK